MAGKEPQPKAEHTVAGTSKTTQADNHETERRAVTVS